MDWLEAQRMAKRKDWRLRDLEIAWGTPGSPWQSLGILGHLNSLGLPGVRPNPSLRSLMQSLLKSAMVMLLELIFGDAAQFSMRRLHDKDSSMDYRGGQP